jgi:hypothetical protein
MLSVVSEADENTKFEVLVAVKISMVVVWVAKLCGIVGRKMERSDGVDVTRIQRGKMKHILQITYLLKLKQFLMH